MLHLLTCSNANIVTLFNIFPTEASKIVGTPYFWGGGHYGLVLYFARIHKIFYFLILKQKGKS